MADEIKQELGFDVAQALEALRSLDAGFASFDQRIASTTKTLSSFNQQGRTAAKTLDGLTQSFNATAAAANSASAGVSAAGTTITTSMSNVGQSARNNLSNATKATNSFLVSFETLSRVVATQAIVRGLNLIRTAVGDSFSDNLEFVRSISEISTIADGESFSRIASQVRQVSDEFNIPLLESAQAKYEAISNGFTTAAQQAEVMTSAIKFSKTAVATLDDSVDAITGTLNAFGEGADRAESVAAKLFRTVDLGKVVGSELATSLGRVSAVSAEVGVSLDEQLAAIGTITIGGVKASEAVTQLRASLSALIKPSDAAKEALRTLGFENGQQLIAARGLQGAFQALIGTTNGSADSIAKLFPNVRALNAVLRLTQTGAARFQEQLQEISNTDVAQFNEKFELRIDTNAERVAADLNRLKNFLTVELGAALVQRTSDLLAFAGGVDGLIDALKALAPVATVAIAALGAYAAAVSLSSLNTRLLNLDLTALTPAFTSLAGQLLGAESAAVAAKAAVGGLSLAFRGLFAVLAAQATIDFLTDRLTGTLQDAVEEFNKGQGKIVAANKSAVDRQIELENRKNQQIARDFNDIIAVKRASYFKDVENAQEANRQLIDGNRLVLDRIISARQSFANDLQRVSDQSQKAVLDSQKRQLDAEGQLEDKRFSFQNRRFSQASQAIRLQQRAEQLASEAASKLAKASTPEDREQSLSLFQRAQGFAEQSAAIADQTNNLGLKLRAERAIEGVLQEQIDAERSLQQIKQADAKRSAELAAQEEQRVTRLKTLAKLILDNSNLFDKQGKPVSEEESTQRRSNARAALDEFRNLAFQGSNFDVSTLFEFDRLRQRIDESITGGEVKSLLATPDALNSLANQIRGSLDAQQFVVRLVPELAGKSFSDQAQGASDRVSEVTEQVADLRRQQSEAIAAQDQINRLAAAIPAIFENGEQGATQFLNALINGFSTSKERITALQSAVEFFKQEIQEGLQNPDFGQGELNNLLNKLTQLDQVAPGFARLDLSTVRSALDQLQQIVQLRQQLEGNAFGPGGEGASQLQQQMQFLETIRQQTEAVRQNTVEAASASFTDSATATQQMAANTAAVLANLKAAAAASAQIRPPVSRATGGMISYLEQGGFAPRGTDTVPAMLSPGEFVVNARSSRQFFSQLQAINAGVAPVFRQDGGAVTNNISVGDINVNGAGNPRETAREVMASIRREQRRGTGRRF
jgi:TP901 family phage tail tape measure protein